MRRLQLLLSLLLLPHVVYADPPAWTVNPAGFSASMSLTAEVFFEGEALRHPDDRVAAFVDGEVRGVAAPLAVGESMLFFLSVHANAEGKGVTFKVYDAAADVVREIQQAELFMSNAVRGLVSEPLVWTAVDAVGPPEWIVEASAFTASMELVGTLVASGAAVPEGTVVAAFVGSEVRGVARVVFVNGQPFFFLRVYAHGNGERLVFKVYDPATTAVRALAGSQVFVAGATVGSVVSPYIWLAQSTSLERGGGGTSDGFDAAYPNPVVGHATVVYRLSTAQRVRLAVIDVLGREVAVLEEAWRAAGTHSARWDPGDLAPGPYILRLSTKSGAFARSITLHR